jgi:hypothetical protein
MAYPTIPGPYGLKPVNEIGGLPYAGSTRMIPITSGYSTSLYNGDLVKLAATGVVNLNATTAPATTQAAQAAEAGTIGVFLGCEYSSAGGPIYGKNRYNYWAASTAAQDAVAYVCDDPNAVFKSAVLSMPAAAGNNTGAITTIGYMSPAFVGTNVYFVGNQNGGVNATGVSLAGVVGNTAGASNGAGNIIKTSTNTAPFRVLQMVPDTAVSVTTTLNAAASSSSLTVVSSSGVYPGMQCIIPAATAGGVQSLNTYVTQVTSTTAVVVSTSVTAVNNSVVTFVGYPEVLVKLNFGYHSYYNATSI